MTTTRNAVRLARPDGTPFWMVYMVRRLATGAVVYIGSTSKPMWCRWVTHGYAAMHQINGAWRMRFAIAIRAEGLFAFQPEEVACCWTRTDALRLEGQLIALHATTFPNGFNSAPATAGGARSDAYVEAVTQARRLQIAGLTDAQRRARIQPALNGLAAKWADHAGREELTRKLREAKTPEANANSSAAAKRRWASMTPEARQTLVSAMTDGTRRSRSPKIRDARQSDLI